MTIIPHISSSKAKQKVKLNIFPNVKPRRGAIENTNPDSSATPDRDKVVPKSQCNTGGTVRIRSRDQTRQVAGRSGGVFEVAGNAKTPWEFQYVIADSNQKVSIPSDRCFLLELVSDANGEENGTPQMSLPTVAFEENARLTQDNSKDDELKLLGVDSDKNTQARYLSIFAMVPIVTNQLETPNNNKQVPSTNVAGQHAKRCEQNPARVKRALKERNAGSMATTKNKSSLYDDGSTLKEFAVDVQIQAPSSRIKPISVVQQVDRNASFTSRADGDSTNTDRVQCLSEQHPLDSDPLLRPRSQVNQETPARFYSVEYQSLSHVRQEDLVSRWSTTTSSTDELAPSSRATLHINVTSRCPAYNPLATQTLLFDLGTTQSPDYAYFRRQFYDLLEQGYRYSHAYDQVMHELIETQTQEGTDDDDGSRAEVADFALTKCEEGKKEQEAEVGNTRLIMKVREETYRLLCEKDMKNTEQ